MYPNTILQTTNPSDVKMVLDTLLATQQCKAVDEQAVLNYDLLFKDPDFSPESTYNPLYFDGDLEEKVA